MAAHSICVLIGQIACQSSSLRMVNCGIKQHRRAASVYSLALSLKMLMNHIIAVGPVPIPEIMGDELLLTNDIYIHHTDAHEKEKMLIFSSSSVLQISISLIFTQFLSISLKKQTAYAVI